MLSLVLMNKIIYILIGLLFLALAGFFVFKYTGIFQKEKPGALQVSSLPKAKIYLADKQIGNTPFMDDKLKPGEYTLKIVPEENPKAVEWLGKVKITSETMTAVTVQFMENGQKEVEILSLEPIEENSPQLLVITTPDMAKISLNGEEKGTSPLIMKDLQEGEQTISVSKSEYNPKSLKAKTVNKYRLTVNLELSKSLEASGTISNGDKSNTKVPTKEMITVKDTPTGWLRVRVEPSLDASEAAKVNPGEEFPFLEEKEGWTKIEYEKGKTGWVSSQYVEKKGSVSGTNTPTPVKVSPTPEPTETPTSTPPTPTVEIPTPSPTP